jgi:MOSC domain-containing protein YiiM
MNTVSHAKGEVAHIFICQEKGSPMQEVYEILAIARFGLSGDRYAASQGSYPTGQNHVTFIALEAIEEANKELRHPFALSETRRNIVTRNIDLDSLVGKEFSIGIARFRGVKLCEPCSRPAAVLGRDSEEGGSFIAAFLGRGGLNAEILAPGLIKQGSSVIV